MGSLYITVKQTVWSKLLFKFILFLGKVRLISLEKAVKVVNLTLSRGAFKYRIGKEKWKKLNSNGKIVIQE